MLAIKATSPDTLLKDVTKELAQTQETATEVVEEHSLEKSPRPLCDIIAEFSDEIDRSLRAGFSDLMNDAQEELDRVYMELQSFGNGLKEKVFIRQNNLIETNNELILKFALPKEFVFTDADVNIINNKTIRLVLVDELYVINIDTSFDQTRLRGHVRIDKKEEAIGQGIVRKKLREYSFKHKMLTKAKLDALTVEYDKTKHILVFTLPKEVTTETKQNIKIKVK